MMKTEYIIARGPKLALTADDRSGSIVLNKEHEELILRGDLCELEGSFPEEGAISLKEGKVSELVLEGLDEKGEKTEDGFWLYRAWCAKVVLKTDDKTTESVTLTDVALRFKGEMKLEEAVDKSIQEQDKEDSAQEEAREGSAQQAVRDEIEEKPLTLKVELSDSSCVLSGTGDTNLVFYTVLDEDAGELLVKVPKIDVTGSFSQDDTWTEHFADGTLTLKQGEYVVISGGSASEGAGKEITVQGSSQSPVTLSVQEKSRFESAYDRSVIAQCDNYQWKSTGSSWPWFLTGALLLLVLATAAVALRLKGKVRYLKRKNRALRVKNSVLESDGPEMAVVSPRPTSSQVHTQMEESKQMQHKEGITLAVGSLHNIGKRPSQQDSLGVMALQKGVFAVVADGMGGLSDGDQVSQQIVRSMLRDVRENQEASLSDRLSWMVARANADVNAMLGQTDHYVSGSTLVSVLAEGDCFHWISVGDSKIYLYRSGALIQLNREHIYEADLMLQAVNGGVSFREAREHAKGKSVSSFIGMGELKYIDTPLHPVSAQRGDRIVLSSDGVFNTVSEAEIARILTDYPDPVLAAQELEAAVMRRNHPYQDNFTAIVIAYQ